MLPVSLLLPVRKLGPWLVVPLSLLLLLVVRCLIVLPPCAFGMVALNLARLITLHGSVLVALVTFPNLPSFCLLGMVGSLQIKFVTLMLCMVGWFMCKRRFGPLSIHDLCVLYHGPSHLPAYWSCPLAHSLGLPCLRGLPLWVWLGLFGSFPPLVSFLRCWLVFRWAVCTFGFVWAPWPPDAMESFVPVGPLPSVFVACFRGGLLWLLLWLPPRSALSIWGQFRSKFTQSLQNSQVFCQSAIESAQNDHSTKCQAILADKDRLRRTTW